MHLINIQNQPHEFPNCIVGLEWQSVPLKDQRLHTRKMRATGYRTVVCGANKDAVNIGQIERVVIPKAGKSVSLAGWVANSFKQGSIVACERVENASETEPESFWLAVVHDGQVAAGTDIVASWDTIASTARETIEILGISDAGYIGSHGGKLPSNFSAKDSLPLADALLKGALRKALIAQDSTSKALPIICAGVAAACVVLGLGGTWAYNSYQEAQAVERAEQARIQRIRRAERDWLAFAGDILTSPPAAATIGDLWSGALADTPDRVGGWRLIEIVCSNTGCLSEYRNGDFTPPAVFESTMAELCTEITYGSNNRTAECTRLVDESLRKPERDALTFDDVLLKFETDTLDTDTLDAFLSDVMMVFHLMKRDTLSISDRAPIKSRGQDLVPGVPSLEQGGWSMEFPLENLPLIIDLLSQYPGLSLVEMSIQGSNKITEISGHYFARVVQQ